MTLARNAYFQRLGIDVWVRRRSSVVSDSDAPRPAARASTGQSSAPPPTIPSAPTASAPLSEPVLAVPRGTFPPGSSKARPGAGVSRPEPPSGRVATSALVAEAFRIRCCHYGGVFVAIAEDAWPRRRFLIDVALALNGFQAAERRELVFDWPQPGAGSGGEGRAFRAFFNHQTRDGARVVLAGSRVPELLGLSPPRQTCVIDGYLYITSQAPDARAKRALWQLIRELG